MYRFSNPGGDQAKTITNPYRCLISKTMTNTRSRKCVMKKETSGETYFLVKWKGWPSEYNQWVSQEDMTNTLEAIQAYRKRKGKENSQIQKGMQRNAAETRTKPKGSTRRKEP